MVSTVRNSKILVAENSAVLATIETMLRAYEVTGVTVFEDAWQYIADNQVGLALIGTHFDRAIELARLVATDSKHETPPMVLVRLLPTMHNIDTDLIKRLVDQDIIRQYLDLHQDPEWFLKLQALAENTLQPS